MTEPLPDQWATRDLPVLRAIVAHMTGDDADEFIDEDNPPSVPGLDEQDIAKALRNLERGRFVTISRTFGGGYMIEDISERALRETGAWPNAETAADHLLWVLEQKVETAASPEERSKWQRMRDAIVSGGRDVAVELAAAMAARTMGA